MSQLLPPGFGEWGGDAKYELRGTLGLRAGSARHARTIKPLLADLVQIEKRIERLKKERDAGRERDLMDRLKAHLEAEQPLRTVELTPEERVLVAGFRSIWVLQPRGDLMAEAPLYYQLHVLMALVLFALWPFSRLVHAFSAPIGYLFRPYIVYRSRDARPRPGATAVRRGWSPVGTRDAKR